MSESRTEAKPEKRAKPGRPTKPGRPAWLSRNVWTLSWVSLLQDAAGEMLYPLMPVFLNTVLGAPAAVIGIIEGAAEGTMAFIKLISDKLNKFLPRKLMVFSGYASAATGAFIIATALTWPVVLVGRLVDRVGKGLRSAPRDAILMRGTEPRARGRIIGFHRSMDTAGAVVGPILALMLLALFDDNLRVVLWWAVVPSVAAMLLVLLIKDGGMRPGRARAGTADEPPSDEGRIDTLVSESGSTRQVASAPASTDPLPPKLRRLISMLAIFSLVNFPDALLLLHLSLRGFSATEVVAAYLVFNIAYALLSFPAGLLADRLGSKYVYAIGLLCFALTYAGLALTDDMFVAFALMVVYGGFSAANDTVGKSWAAKLTPSHLQLKAQARLQGFSGFGILIAGIWAGIAWNAGAGLTFGSADGSLVNLGDGGVPMLIAAGFAILVAVYVAIFAPRSGFAATR